ncbi:alpha,alpha-trehalose-phosphate synthase (UDP-forming) [Neoroseomonas lacus]|uniref:Trehalose-6-phosphate synthase n=1 Tax=Neoroseomonas lacus TaxID=287609 RepID=A0A917NP56_9PROT|nr:trehalose-6-phosphate synthase [Neoroseomonas lacus]GGJ15012.1 trehalose-6-phosphate synthase [Neoroseomonas lacus]
MARLVIVSNRVPPPRTTGAASAGGLAVALQSFVEPGTLWFGWSGRVVEKPSGKPRIVDGQGVTYATIDLNGQDYDRFYVGFANSSLWPLLHFRLGLMRYRREDFEGYLAVNGDFADALLPMLRPDDMVWVHDYHLIPLAAALRARGFAGRIGFFLHIPFVPASVLEALPPAYDLLCALCAFDVVGFQTRTHLADFLDCARRFTGFTVEGDEVVTNGRHVRAIADPIGIDAAGFARVAGRAAGTAYIKRMRESLSGRALAISAERLDYSKGLPNRFEGFARLLARYPQQQRHISMLQIAARSREDVAEYQALRRELDRLAGDINGRFSQFDWVPLRYMTQTVARTKLAGLFRIARIGIVTPLRDGMNLVAKEFVAAQDPADPGVLILSQFAGAAEELTDALLVNPYDPDAIADAMNTALEMPLGERQQRHAALRRAVFEVTAARYCNVFVDALKPA